MLSHNNQQELLRRTTNQQQRFALKKLTIGVASVLIGFTYLGVNQVAHADTVPANQSTQTVTSQPTTANDDSGKQVALPTSSVQAPVITAAQSTTPTKAEQPAVPTAKEVAD